MLFLSTRQTKCVVKKLNKGGEPLEGVEAGQGAGKAMGHLPGRARDKRQASPLGTPTLSAEEQGQEDLAHSEG